MTIWTPDERHITLPEYLRNVDVPDRPLGDCAWLRCRNIATRTIEQVTVKPKQLKGREVTIPELCLCLGHYRHAKNGQLVLEWGPILEALGLDPV